MPPDDIQTSDRSKAYVIGGDEECPHTLQFLGADMASNRYYRCQDCGGAIVEKGRSRYGDDGIPSGEADRAALTAMEDDSEEGGPSSNGTFLGRLRSSIESIF